VIAHRLQTSLQSARVSSSKPGGFVAARWFYRTATGSVRSGHGISSLSLHASALGELFGNAGNLRDNYGELYIILSVSDVRSSLFLMCIIYGSITERLATFWIHSLAHRTLTHRRGHIVRQRHARTKRFHTGVARPSNSASHRVNTLQEHRSSVDASGKNSCSISLGNGSRLGKLPPQ